MTARLANCQCMYLGFQLEPNECINLPPTAHRSVDALTTASRPHWHASYFPAGEYGLACEHSHSCCILLARTDRFKRDGQWHTWIDYDRFQELAASGECTRMHGVVCSRMYVTYVCWCVSFICLKSWCLLAHWCTCTRSCPAASVCATGHRALLSICHRS